MIIQIWQNIPVVYADFSHFKSKPTCKMLLKIWSWLFIELQYKFATSQYAFTFFNKTKCDLNNKSIKIKFQLLTFEHNEYQNTWAWYRFCCSFTHIRLKKCALFRFHCSYFIKEIIRTVGGTNKKVQFFRTK